MAGMFEGRLGHKDMLSRLYGVFVFCSASICAAMTRLGCA